MIALERLKIYSKYLIFVYKKRGRAFPPYVVLFNWERYFANFIHLFVTYTITHSRGFFRWLLARDEYSVEARVAIKKLRGFSNDEDVQVGKWGDGGYRKVGPAA